MTDQQEHQYEPNDTSMHKYNANDAKLHRRHHKDDDEISDVVRPLPASPSRPDNNNATFSPARVAAANKSLLDVSYDTSCVSGSTFDPHYDNNNNSNIGMGISAINCADGLLDETFDSTFHDLEDEDHNHQQHDIDNDDDIHNHSALVPKILFPEEVGRGPIDEEEVAEVESHYDEYDGIDVEDDDSAQSSAAATYTSVKRRHGSSSPSASFIHTLTDAVETSLVITSFQSISESFADSWVCGRSAATPHASPRRRPTRETAATTAERHRGSNSAKEHTGNSNDADIFNTNVCVMALGGDMECLLGSTDEPTPNEVVAFREMGNTVRAQFDKLDCYANTGTPVATPVRRKNGGNISTGSRNEVVPGAPRKSALGRDDDISSRTTFPRNRAGEESVKVRTRRMHRLLLEQTLTSSGGGAMLLEKASTPSLLARRRQVPKSSADLVSRTVDTTASSAATAVADESSKENVAPMCTEILADDVDNKNDQSISMISEARSFGILDEYDDDEADNIFRGNRMEQQKKHHSSEESTDTDEDFGPFIGDCIDPIPIVIDDSDHEINKDSAEEKGRVDMSKRSSIAPAEDSCYDSDPGLVETSFARKKCFVENTSNNVFAREQGSRQMKEPVEASLLTIQNTLNETVTLTWHPSVDGSTGSTGSNSTGRSKTSSPRCVTLWMDRGQRLANKDKNGLIEPQIVWRDAYQPSDNTSRRSQVSSMARKPNTVAMLNVCRVLSCSVCPIDRNKYPFAKTSCSFIIRTCDKGDFLFQARNAEERDNLVWKWKLVVARLASLAIVDNGDALSREFFRSYDDGFLDSPWAVMDNLNQAHTWTVR